ncbi:MAG: YfhO family protein, partial [Ignavibacteria bacterium]|nr:YfhO family protein [Ignavibacteria bacterium]
LDGEVIRDFYSYEPQYSSVYVKEDFNELKIEVTNLYGVPEEEFINTASIEYPETYFEDWYKWLSKSFVENIKLSNNSFSGSFSSDKEQWIVTSIAYDKNWKVFVNDKQVEVEKVNGGFIGFKVQSGVLKIQGTYFPEELKVGLIISIVSLIIIFLTKNKRWI